MKRVVAAAMFALCALGTQARERNVDVRHIALDLRFDWAARQAYGHATLSVAPLKAADRITLDAGRLAIESITLEHAARKGKRLAFDYDGGERDDGLAVVLDRRYAAHEALTLRIAYRTQWVNHSDPNNLAGSSGKGLRFHLPSFTEPQRRRQIWAGGDPGANRWWFPSFDAPGDLRTSELRATVEAPLTVVAGGRLVGVKRNADGTRTFHWKTERPEPNHRTTLVVGEYVDVPQRHGKVWLHNLSYPDEVEGTTASTAKLPDMVALFERLAGVRYPHARYTQAFVQDLPWGTPGSGFAAQTENMVDDAGTHDDFHYLWHGLQAESLAQQWFGGLVPICDWPHAWLERGLARHFMQRWAEHHNGRDELLLWQLQADQAAAVADAAQEQTRNPIVDAEAADAVAYVTGNAPYARAAAVLHLLRRQVGDAAWDASIRRWLRTRAGRPSCTDDFRRAVEAESGQPLTWFFDQWFHRAGHPVFEVTKSWDAAARRLELSVMQLQTHGFYRGPVDVQIDGRVQRVQLAPQAENVFAFALDAAPRLVHFDHGGAWIKELRFAKPTDELLHQWRHDGDAAGRQWALQQLAPRWKDDAATDALRADIRAALLEVAGRKSLYWRVRFNALAQLATLLSPAQPKQPVPLDETTQRALLDIVRDPSAWLRTAAIRVLGLSRDARHAELYLRHLAHAAEPSDRVVNAAAIALGRSGSDQAFDALRQLPSRPSWKNQSLISALAGLQQLGDARAVPIALAALQDRTSAHWTLATPVWDYRLAAAEALAALGAAGQALPMVRERFDRALAAGEINDIFSNVLLLVTLGDARAPEEVFAPLRRRFAADAEALKAVAQYETQLAARLKLKP